MVDNRLPHIKIEDIVIGQRLTDSVYVLKSLKKDSEKVYMTISDKSGELDCYMPLSRYDSSYENMVSGAVKVNGIIEVGANQQPLGKIRSLAIAEAGSFDKEELFAGISDEKRDIYIADIRDRICKIPDPACRQLCSILLNDEMLMELANYPASVAFHGKFGGGALVATSVVTDFCIKIANTYLTKNHGMYKLKIDWSALVTAALLMYVAHPDYFIDNPWRKSPLAVDRGYMSLLQSKIERCIYSNNIEISDEMLARLLNILGASVALKTAVKATCIEGIILRNSLIMYEEMDMLDAEIAKHELQEGETYFFDGRLGRHIAVDRILEVAR